MFEAGAPPFASDRPIYSCGPDAGEETIAPRWSFQYEPHVVWQDARFTGFAFDQVAISASSDAGATWSAPARVNTPTGQSAFTPSVRVNSGGTVAVTCYDFRNLTAGNMSVRANDGDLANRTDAVATTITP